MNELFIGLIMSKIRYALPAFAGHLTADDRNRINAISQKALCHWVAHFAFNIAEVIRDLIVQERRYRGFREGTEKSN